MVDKCILRAKPGKMDVTTTVNARMELQVSTSAQHCKFFFSILWGLVIFVVQSDVDRWLFLEVCLLGNFWFARCFPFLLCEEGMTAGHWLLVCRGKGLAAKYGDSLGENKSVYTPKDLKVSGWHVGSCVGHCFHRFSFLMQFMIPLQRSRFLIFC